MILAFLIATLIIFSLNLVLALLTIGFYFGTNMDAPFPIVQFINVFACLIMLTWNILALISL